MTTKTITVDIEIDIDEFSDDELIEEIKYRGYKIYDEEVHYAPLLDKYECEVILAALEAQEVRIGSELYTVISKLRDIYNGNH
jgi:hypothetical protein